MPEAPVSPPPVVETREEVALAELARLDARIAEWEGKVADASAKNREALVKAGEARGTSRAQRTLQAYGRTKKSLLHTENQLIILQEKRATVATTVDTAIMAETLQSANAAFANVAPSSADVADTMADAAEQEELITRTAHAYATVVSTSVEDDEYLEDLAQFEVENNAANRAQHSLFDELPSPPSDSVPVDEEEGATTARVPA